MKYLEKIITKELLRKVLPKETENLSEDFSFYIDEDYIVFRDEGETLFDYNIYKFAFKCKKWARDKYDITISSSLYKNYAKSWNIDKDKSYTAKTEVEVIIEACNWIMEQSNEKI